MIYVTSDLHGYPLEEFKVLLDKVGFNKNDFLFVLGDVVDRGDDSIKILQWLMVQPNSELILGNHEAMMLACDFLCDEITDESISKLTEDKISCLSTWMVNGGESTIKALRELKKTSADSVFDVFDFIREAPLYETVSAGSKNFLLVHSGLENFRKDKRLSEYTSDELLWNEPELDDRYFDNTITVFGHTPTRLFGQQYGGKILKTDTWVCIDTNSGHSGSPSLLRLDDMKEFYIKKGE